MKRLAFASIALLIGCAGPRAPVNPNSIPNITLSITQTRTAQAPFIYMTGGIYDGGAAGQTANFVVTPDDAVVCTFQTDPVLPGDGDRITVTGHRLTVPGIYALFSAAALPNVGAVEVEYSTNFTIESWSPAGVTTTQTGFGDPRFAAITTIFNTTPNPCWNFG